MSKPLVLHDGTGVIARSPDQGILIAYGSTVPTGAGYAPGAKFIKTNGTSLQTTTFVNVGTKAAANFVTEGALSTSPTIGVGYATGAGGAVAQATNRTTAVTLDKITGQITTQATSLAAQTSAAFTVNNSTVAIGDVIVLSVQSGPTGTKTICTVTTVAAGSFQINMFNTDASVADTGAAIINFAVIKAVGA